MPSPYARDGSYSSQRMAEVLVVVVVVRNADVTMGREGVGRNTDQFAVSFKQDER